MIRIHRPIKPNKRSGFELKPEHTTTLRGVTITNISKSSVYVDKYSVKRKPKARK